MRGMCTEKKQNYLNQEPGKSRLYIFNFCFLQPDRQIVEQNKTFPSKPDRRTDIRNYRVASLQINIETQFSAYFLVSAIDKQAFDISIFVWKSHLCMLISFIWILVKKFWCALLLSQLILPVRAGTLDFIYCTCMYLRGVTVLEPS